MTFNQYEDSVEDSRPIEFFEIALGGTTFNLTSAVDEITIGPTTYTPVFIDRTELLHTSEQNENGVTMRMAADHPFPQNFITSSPGSRATVNIKRLQRLDIGGDNELVLFFKGVVKNVRFIKQGRIASISIDPLLKGLIQQLPRYSFQNLCNHYLYDDRCKVVEGLFTVVGVVSVVNELVITVPGLSAKPDGTYTAGFIKLQAANDFRLITDHVGNDITILIGFPGDVTGVAVDVTEGCDHSLPTCKTKFDNVINYGGHPFVPLKDPFRTGFN